MRISGITVCVNYSDLLAKSIAVWKRTLDRVIVVTTPSDTATISLCKWHGCEYYETEAFTRNGATFNKGAALSEAVEATGFRTAADWLLSFDADILPPEQWQSVVEGANPQPDTLYGARRFQCDPDDVGKEHARIQKIGDGEICGYFALFHSIDHNAQRTPLYETCWPHAGCYDSEFQSRWNIGRDMRRWLPLNVLHLGATGKNWWGRDNDAAMARMMGERVRRRGYQHERLPLP